MKLTGSKTDKWLVVTVGWLITISAIVMLMAAFGSITKEIIALAVLDAFILGIIDVYYVSKKVISKVYLGDAVVEFLLVLAWGFVFIQSPQGLI
ncbi:hypothetical protein [Bdellovibrio reynosensis]|uniref:Uncharacterized protein n=1 Tax=Bdellovibrio reynosensis TaxID=2835041 RepID=A0ABY4C546_9BACT|nr:hypothetical protein [Bdellovibrio reynosensis]UOF00083.1 hypothetical protein MNR06_10255 [Bdellovibrio reynosensis]